VVFGGEIFGLGEKSFKGNEERGLFLNFIVNTH
jgi:hypothetical protein